VSQLKREQRTACFSSLSWSSAHYRDSARGAELMLPEHKPLPRDNLLLIGSLCDGRASGSSDGVWRVRDAGGSVSCTVSVTPEHMDNNQKCYLHLSSFIYQVNHIFMRINKENN